MARFESNIQVKRIGAREVATISPGRSLRSRYRNEADREDSVVRDVGMIYITSTSECRTNSFQSLPVRSKIIFAEA